MWAFFMGVLVCAGRVGVLVGVLVCAGRVGMRVGMCVGMRVR